MPYADKTSAKARACARASAHRHYWSHRDAEIKRAALWANENPDRVNELSVIRRSERMSPERVLLNNAKNRAKANGVAFNLTIEDIVVPKFCPVFGIPLIIAVGHARDGSPSIDRIRPDGGYVRGNVQVISHKANTMKSNGTLEDLKKIVAWMEKTHGA